MRIVFGDAAMRGPARVPDPLVSARGFLMQFGLQSGELADGAPDREVAPIHDRNPRRVIAPVLEALQAADHDVGCFTRSDVSYDATHKRSFSIYASCGRAASPSRTAKGLMFPNQEAKAVSIDCGWKTNKHENSRHLTMLVS